jgi:hypothetical protein
MPQITLRYNNTDAAKVTILNEHKILKTVEADE